VDLVPHADHLIMRRLTIQMRGWNSNSTVHLLIQEATSKSGEAVAVRW